jgi:ABC-type multidrug transport system ATPase subunit
MEDLESEKDEEIKAVREQILILGKAKQVCEKENKALREAVESAKKQIILTSHSMEEISSLKKCLLMSQNSALELSDTITSLHHSLEVSEVEKKTQKKLVEHWRKEFYRVVQDLEGELAIANSENKALRETISSQNDCIIAQEKRKLKDEEEISALRKELEEAKKPHSLDRIAQDYVSIADFAKEHEELRHSIEVAMDGFEKIITYFEAMMDENEIPKNYVYDKAVSCLASLSTLSKKEMK